MPRIPDLSKVPVEYFELYELAYTEGFSVTDTRRTLVHQRQQMHSMRADMHKLNHPLYSRFAQVELTIYPTRGKPDDLVTMEGKRRGDTNFFNKLRAEGILSAVETTQSEVVPDADEPPADTAYEGLDFGEDD